MSSGQRMTPLERGVSANIAVLAKHAYSVLYAHKLTTIRCALGKSSCSQGLGLEQGAACHPLDPH